jgi:hypothetical protein
VQDSAIMLSGSLVSLQCKAKLGLCFVYDLGPRLALRRFREFTGHFTLKSSCKYRLSGFGQKTEVIALTDALGTRIVNYMKGWPALTLYRSRLLLAIFSWTGWLTEMLVRQLPHF